MTSDEWLALAQDVRDRVSIDRVTGPLRIETVTVKAVPVGTCPKCKSLQMQVNPKRGFFHCFQCKASGSAIDFVMERDGLSFRDAVAKLAELLPKVPE
jgi:DNA primase